MAGGGVALGLATSAAAAPYAADLLLRVSPRDPLVLGGVAVVLLFAALLASFLPGLRATRVDAMEALRAD
jgi:ABC-type lipoprotein release transport system permease subunit